MKLPARSSCGAMVAALCAWPVFAQDYSLSPNFGSATLSSGFEPDPHVVAITAGGNHDASDADSSCTGSIADAPDYSVEYTADGYVLSFFVDSESDTTLLINAPTGDWHCNDDSGYLDGNNPGIIFDSPASGRYDVWVGVYGTSDYYPDATLLISERNEDSWRDMVANLDLPAPVEPEPEPEPEPIQPQPTQPQTLQPAVGNLQYGRKL